MPEVKIGSVPFQEAIDHFQGKLKIPTEHWDDMLGTIHAKAFTIAGATKADLLTDIFNDVNEVLSNGGTITDYRKLFDKTVNKHGWPYKGNRGWRTRVIYDTNLRTSHMAGKWSQFQRVKQTRPFLQYFTVGDERVRPEHREWHHLVLHIDDPWWQTHYPPNGWGCRCGARSLSPRQIRKEKLQIAEQAPAIQTTDRLILGKSDKQTGEIPVIQVPKGIDTGWNYNVGQAWLGPDIAFGEKLMAMPNAMRTAALNNAKDLTQHLQKDFAPWVTKLEQRSKPLNNEIKTVGYLSPKVIDELIRRDQVPSTAVITTTDKDIIHMIREAKDGRHIPLDQIRAMPTTIGGGHSAVLWDKRDPALVYVFDVPGDDRTAKAIIRVNYKIKVRDANGKRQQVQTNTLRTGGLVQLQNLKEREVYEVIDGEL